MPVWFCVIGVGGGEQKLTHCECCMHRIRCPESYVMLGGKTDKNTGRGYLL